MPNAFHGINMASSALRSFQRALDVTGNNIANVNTPGYSRQVVDFSEQDPTLFFNGGAHMMGNGVTIASINRVRDMFLEARRYGAAAEGGELGAANSAASRIESLFAEPGGSGISDAMDKFFNAWSALSSSPNDATLRTQVQTAGQMLSDRVRGTYQQLQGVQAQQNASIQDTIGQAQGLTNQIAELNDAIRDKVAQGALPNDLMDMRDRAITSLSGLMEIQTHNYEDGSVVIFSGTLSLVNQDGAETIPTVFDPVAKTLTGPTQTFAVKGGQLLGQMQGFTDAAAVMGQLDTLANQMRAEVNGIHKAGTNPNGTTNIAFFNENAVAPQNGAIDFDLAAPVKADPNNIATSATGAPGDGSLALQLSQMRDKSVAALSGKTFNKFFSAAVSNLANNARYLSVSAETQDAVIAQIDAQIQSISGVSADDEMANMLKFQRSYQAAAKMFTIFDSVTQDLLNMLNR